MKNVIKLSLLVALALFNACSKSSDSSKTPTDAVTHKLLATTTVNGFTTTYSYDTKHKLILATTPSSQTTYAYYDDGTLYLVTTTSGNIRDTYEVTYNLNHKVSAVAHKRYKDDLANSSDLATLTYDDTGNLIQVKRDGDGGLGVTKYYYDANNVINKTDGNDGNAVNTYTYDDKKTPYTDMVATDKNIITGSLDMLVPHNILVTNSYSGISLTTTIYNYTYVYDSDGYPTSRTQSFKVGNQNIQSTTTYTYTTY